MKTDVATGRQNAMRSSPLCVCVSITAGWTWEHIFASIFPAGMVE